jgi:hypothetical protein
MRRMLHVMRNTDQGDDGEAANAHTPGLSASRQEQLRRDLLLTPEERVRAAEETLTLDRLRHGGAPSRVIGFDRYEDYLDYKWKLSTGGA